MSKVEIPQTVYLKRVINGKPVDHLVTIVEAEFSIVNNTVGEILWTGKKFTLDLSNEKVKESWDKLVSYKVELLKDKIDSYEITKYIEDVLNKRTDAIEKQYTDELNTVRQQTVQVIEEIKQATVESIKQVNVANDNKTESVRKEYNDSLGSIKALLEDFTSGVSGVKADVDSIKDVAKQVKTLKNDVTDMTKTLNSLIEE